MRTAFEIAVEVSYYKGELWKIATDPDILEGYQPENAETSWVAQYGQTDKNKIILSGNVPRKIKDLFDDLSKHSAKGPLDEYTRNSLTDSLSALRKILSREDPAPGYTTSFSNMQQPLKSEMQEIEILVKQLGLEAEPTLQV